MTTKPRRILVPIDFHGINQRSLEALVMMAERLGVGLDALFVEDMVLEQVAELPFAVEVVRTSGVERRLYAEALRRRKRTLTYSVRAQFEEYARQRKVSVKFEFAQGARALTAFGRRGGDIFFSGRSTPQGVRSAAQGELYRRVKLVYDSSSQAERAVEIVHALVSNGHTREIFIVAESRVPARLLRSLMEAGARVYLDNSPAGGTERDSLNRFLGRPASDLVLLPYTAIESLPRRLLEAAIDRSVGSVLVLDAHSPV